MTKEESAKKAIESIIHRIMEKVLEDLKFSGAIDKYKLTKTEGSEIAQFMFTRGEPPLKIRAEVRINETAE